MPPPDDKTFTKFGIDAAAACIIVTLKDVLAQLKVMQHQIPKCNMHVLLYIALLQVSWT